MLDHSAAESADVQDEDDAQDRARRLGVVVIEESETTAVLEAERSVDRQPLSQGARRLSGRLLVAANFVADLLVLGIIANAIVPWMDREAVARFGWVEDTAVGRELATTTFGGGLTRVVVILAYVGIMAPLLLPTYRLGRLVRRPAELITTIAGRLAVAIALTIVVLGVSAATPDIAFAVWCVSFIALLLVRLAFFKIAMAMRSRGFDRHDVLIVGAGPVAVELAEALDGNPESGLLPIGFVDRAMRTRAGLYDSRDNLPLPLLGSPERLRDVIEEHDVHHVVLAFGQLAESKLVPFIRECEHLSVRFYAVPRFFELGTGTTSDCHEVDGFTLVPLNRAGHGNAAFRIKRMFDVSVAASLIFVFSPVMALCALAVRVSSPGPILFRQVRVGLNGKPFEILKFRSMRVNDDSSTQWSVDDDDRVTAVGEFLRKSHLDELPQLFNVLRGDMSIVGPRPERPYFVEQFSSEIQGYDDRHRVPVGITGLAQVNGYWGDTSIEARVRHDNRYIQSWSLWREIVILIRTIPTLLGKRR